MKIEYLKECMMLAETLSFSATAERSYTTQPAVSRHVTQVEHELGFRIFERTTHGVAITDAGKVALEGFRSSIAEYDHACDEARKTARGIVDSLAISSPYYWTEKYTEPIVRSLMELSPSYEAQLIACQPIEGFEQMASGESDVALSMAMHDCPDGINCAPFAREPLAVMMCCDNPLASRETIRIEELDIDTLVTLDRKRYSMFVTPFASMRIGDTIKAKHVVEVEQIEMVAMAVQQTGGISIMPYEARRMDRSYIHTIRIENPETTLELCHYWRADNTSQLLHTFVAAADEMSFE